MANLQILENRLKRIDGKDYGAYQSLKGEYDYSGGFKLIIHLYTPFPGNGG